MSEYGRRVVENPQRIAIFRALHLGDMLLSVPAFRAIRTQYPQAEITLIGLEWARSFAERFRRYIDAFAEFPGFPGIREVPHQPDRTARFLRRHQRMAYDLAVQMHGSGQSSNTFVLGLDAARTVGYYVDRPPASSFVGRSYPNEQHEICRNLGLAEIIGCANLSTALEFPLLDDDRQEASRELARTEHAGGPLVVIHPGARASSRRWGPSRFAAVADHLIETVGASVAIAGSSDEAITACEVLAGMKHTGLDLVGRTTIGGLAAIIAEADLFIGNDSGPAHLAEAVGTRSVVLFGPEDPARWASIVPGMQTVVRRDVECSPCHLVVCPIDHRCLELVEPEVVSRAALNMLRRVEVAGLSSSPSMAGSSTTLEDAWIG